MFAAITFSQNTFAIPGGNETGRRVRAARFKRDAIALNTLGNYNALACNTVQLTVTSSFDINCSNSGAVLYRLIMRGKGDALATTQDRFLITACRVAARHGELFLRQFEQIAAFLRQQAGLVRFRLFESCDATASYRFINVAQWHDLQLFKQAFDHPEFRCLLRGGFDLSSDVMVADPIPALSKKQEKK